MDHQQLKERAIREFKKGKYEDVSPPNGQNDWTKITVLDAIRRGVADGFDLRPGFFGGEPYIVAYQFKNRRFANIIARATLEGFGIKPPKRRRKS